jgi:TRAP-type C4-dicarboxylate transport system permease small subunit
MGDRLQKLAERIGVAIFAAMFASFLLQVFFRYVLNRPLGWTDELSLVLYPWAVFWACAFIVRLREHVAFDLVYHGAAPPVRRAFAVIGGAVLLVLFVTALPATVDYVVFMARERTPVLGWRYDLVFACFPIFLIALALQSAWRLRRLLGRSWQDSV